MDELEARMESEERKIRFDLGELGALLGTGGGDLETATSGYARYAELKTRILDLSRQNTNVRLLIISLNKKGMAVEMCQDLLAALERSIQDERLVEREPMIPR